MIIFDDNAIYIQRFTPDEVITLTTTGEARIEPGVLSILQSCRGFRTIHIEYHKPLEEPRELDLKEALGCLVSAVIDLAERAKQTARFD